MKNNSLKKILFYINSAYLAFYSLAIMMPSRAWAADQAQQDQTAAQSITLSSFLQTFYMYLSRFTLAASFLMLILAIYVYMTSNGDTKKLGKAKEYLTSAIVGLVAVAFAYTFFEILNPEILKIKS